MWHYIGDYYKIPGLRSGYPVWKKSNGRTKYLLHDENYKGWLVQDGISVAVSELESERTPPCPTQVNKDRNNWWNYDAKVGKKWIWKADKSHHLHVECYQPGKMMQEPSGFENKTIEKNSIVP